MKDVLRSKNKSQNSRLNCEGLQQIMQERNIGLINNLNVSFRQFIVPPPGTDFLEPPLPQRQ